MTRFPYKLMHFPFSYLVFNAQCDNIEQMCCGENNYQIYYMSSARIASTIHLHYANVDSFMNNLTTFLDIQYISNAYKTTSHLPCHIFDRLPTMQYTHPVYCVIINITAC